MVRRHVPAGRERRACYRHLIKWWAVNWNAARVAVDVIALAFPGVLAKAEAFKQKVFSPEPGPNIKAREQEQAKKQLA
jgi:hypothetical protein